MVRNDPYAQFNFLVELAGKPAGGFSEVSGISSETDVIEYREGSDPPHVRKLPGLAKTAILSLKRGYTLDISLWEWRNTTLTGATERRDGAIILLDEGGKPRLRWEFYEGWISKWEGPAMKATENGPAIEALSIVAESLKLVKSS